MDRAKYICVVVDVTPGVLWEIFHHLDTIPKTLYIVSDVNKIQALFKSPEYKKYSNTSLGMSLFCVSNLTAYNEFAFYISNGLCYYASIKEMSLYLRSHRLTKGIKTITLNNTILQKENIEKDKSTLNKKQNHFIYKILDITRMFSRFLRKAFRGGIKSIAYILYILLCLGCVLSSLSGLIGGIVVIIDMYHNGFSWENILKCLFAFGLCIYMARNFVSLWKDK